MANSKETTRESPPAPKQTRASPDKWSQAAALSRRLEKLDRAEQAELEDAPNSIKERYAEKRRRALDGQPGEVVALVLANRQPPSE